MQYSTWRHIPEDDTAEDGSDNFLRNVGYEVETCSIIIHGVVSQFVL
jgi:hypothetical protein